MKINTVGVGVMAAVMILGSSHGFCLTSGTDIVIPAAGRGADDEVVGMVV